VAKERGTAAAEAAVLGRGNILVQVKVKVLSRKREEATSMRRLLCHQMSKRRG
jgi:hypothetical protein